MALIKRIALENRTWGAERIRGDLLKLGVRVSTNAIRKYLKQVRLPGSSKQNWGAFLRNHASQMWACDFLQTYDVLFRAVFVNVADASLSSWARAVWSILASPDTNRPVDSSATAGSHAIWCKATILDPGQRPQVCRIVRSSSCRDQCTENAIQSAKSERGL